MGIAHPSVVPGYFDLRRLIAKNVAVLDDAALVRQCASRCVLPQQHPSCAESSPAAPRSQSARYPPRCRTREEAVARGLDQPTMMFRNLRVDHLSPDRPEPIEGALFVCPDQARIAGHIGGQDCRQPTFSACASPCFHCYLSTIPKPPTGSDFASPSVSW
jgi:hypothetical protein